MKYLSDKNNRSWTLLKRKDWQDDEFTCVGAIEGEGKFQGTLGALVCWANDKGAELRMIKNPLAQGFIDASKFSVGSGLTDGERAYYWTNPPIGRLIKVKYLCLSSDGIPLNPTIHPDHEVK